MHKIPPRTTMFSKVVSCNMFCATVLLNVLCLTLHIFLYLEAFECNTISDWLNHMAKPYGLANQKCVLHSNLLNLGEKDKECT